MDNKQMDNKYSNTKDFLLTDIKKSKIGIIYIYYERKNEQKNQTNLSFFIKHGLNKNNWPIRNIITLFVINGHQCEVTIPDEPDIYVLKEENCSDWEGWLNGINYFENKFNNKIWEIFDYLCLINAGCIGPLIDSNNNIHWIDFFYEKMKIENSPICSPCITFLPETDLGGPGPRVVPIITLIKINKEIILLLTVSKISLKCENSIIPYPNLSNTILGNKTSKADAILSGEYGLSRIFLNNGYKICSLLYDNIDYNNKNNWNLNNNFAPDRYKSFNNNNLPLDKVIFVKNIWRVENLRVCLPSNINNTQKITNEILNYENIIFTNLNYDDIIVDTIGKNLTNAKYNWNDKKTFYKLYGYAEEFIIFPKIIKNKSLAIYVHYDSDNIIKDYVIISLKSLIEVGYDVIFITTSKTINNIDLPINILFYPNKGPGSDILYWNDVLSKNINNYIENYDWILLLNDSIIFPIHGIDNFKKTIINMRNISDFWCHWESNEICNHGISSQMEFNIKVIPSLITFFSTKLNGIISHTKDYYVKEIEIKLTKYLISKEYKFNSVISISSLILPNNLSCPIFHPDIYEQWINRKETFAIKWKYMLNYMNLKLINNPILNYLTRYVYVGPNGIKGEPEKVGVYIDPNIVVFMNDIILQNDLIINNNIKLCIVASYSKNNIIDENIVLLVKELIKYNDMIIIVSNIKYNFDNKNINSLTYSTNSCYDIGIYYRIILKLKKQYHLNFKEILLINDSNIIINNFNNFYNWSYNYNDCLIGLTECNPGWGFSHIMSNFLLFKGNSIEYLYNFIINYDINKLLLNKNNSFYYKNYIINNFNILKSKNMSYSEYYHTYIVYTFEMCISHYIRKNNINIIPYLSCESLSNNYKFNGIPIFENSKLFLNLLPVTKKKVIEQQNLYDVIKDLRIKNNII